MATSNAPLAAVSAAADAVDAGDGSAVRQTTMADVREALDNGWQPAIPLPVVRHYLASAGVVARDDVVLKVVAAEVQHFVTKIVSDARFAAGLRVHAKDVRKRNMRTGVTATVGAGAGGGSAGKSDKVVLLASDVVEQLTKSGFKPVQAPYFV